MTLPTELLTILSGVTIVLVGAAVLALFRMQPLLERMDERTLGLKQEQEQHERNDDTRFADMRIRIDRIENILVTKTYAGG